VSRDSQQRAVRVFARLRGRDLRAWEEGIYKVKNLQAQLFSLDSKRPGDPEAGITAAGDCSRPARGPDADYIPNVVVHTHENRKALFYDDLLLGKRVLISSVSTREQSSLAIIENLAKVQALMGAELGRRVFIYSITANPEHDTPQALRSFAEQYGARDGWLFLTGEPSGINLLRERMFHQSDHDCSATLFRYGCPSYGLWGSIPVNALPESIVQRVSWLEEGLPVARHPRRRGPASLSVTS